MEVHGEFESSFQEGLWVDGTADERSAGFAPWQNSLVERHGRTWKDMFAKVIATMGPGDRDHVEELCEQITVAKNSLVNRDGFSPSQRVFGKEPRVPGLLYSGEPHVGINSGVLAGEPSFVKSIEIRQAARKAFIDADNEERIRRAIEHRTRPERGPFIPGCKVYVWRPGKPKSTRAKTNMWRGPGTVIGNTDQSKFWVSFGSKILKCAPEQLRRLTPEDEAAIPLIPPELVDWSHETSKRGVATFHDISMEGRPAEEKGDHWELNGNVLRRIHVDERHYQYVPTLEDQPPVQLELLLSDRRTAIESHVSPTRYINDDWRAMGRGERMESGWTGYTEFRWKRKREDEDIENDLSQEFPTEPGAAVGATRMEGQEEGASESEMLAAPSGSNDTIQPSTASQSQGSDVMEEDDSGEPLIEVISGPTTVTDAAVPQLQQVQQSGYGPIRETGLTRALRQDAQRLDGHRPPGHAVTSDVLNTELCSARWVKGANGWKIDWEAGMIIKLHDWRRTKFTPTARECPIPLSWLTGTRYTLVREENSDNGFQTIEDDFKQDKATKMGHWWAGYTIFEFDGVPRINEMEEEEYKVNEVTLSEVQSEKHQLWEGKRSELEKLLRFEAVKVILPADARNVRETERILPSRFVITKKPCEKEPGRYVTKARWCIRGYLDPDLLKMETQAPTLSAEALSLVLQLAASNRWELTIADVEGAFLQGDSLKRQDGDVFVELPPGGIPGLPEGTLLKLLKPVYGLSDAPRAWFTKLKKTLIQHGLRQSVLDPCLYHYWYNGKLEGSLAVHVDDLITTKFLRPMC